AEKMADYASNASNEPLVNISEMVTRLSTPSFLESDIFGSPANRAIKTQREAAIRAMAGSVQSRTWNLLIDLVAQSGRIPAGATGLDQFQVEGEQRYWLHIAMDRFTGEIIDEQIETVVE